MKAETFESETLHEKGDYRIIAVEDDDFWDERWTDSSKEMAEEYGVYTLQLQKKVMGGWETIDALSGVIASDYGADSLKEFALTDMEIPDGVNFDAETFESESDCREAKEEVKKLRRKIALLDKLYDKENALHHEILGSGGFFKKHELKGLFSEKDLKNYEYWNAETFSAESNLDHRSANLRELQKLLERELSRLAEDNYKIEEQLKKLERGNPKEYSIEIIRDLLSDMHESLGAINGYGMNYLSLLQ